MTYSQAKLAAHDYSITDAAKLIEAAALLLGRLDCSDDDMADAADLADRARRLQAIVFGKAV